MWWTRRRPDEASEVAHLKRENDRLRDALRDATDLLDDFGGARQMPMSPTDRMFLKRAAVLLKKGLERER